MTDMVKVWSMVFNHRPVASHCQTLSHNVVSSTLRHERGSTTTQPLVLKD